MAGIFSLKQVSHIEAFQRENRDMASGYKRFMPSAVTA
ncbi:hypothetical protein ZBT109_0052 [Zymobacter palmae]|uniref:Uncharacterized protein n=1 Tax=Zymobacter palmae TaxID=33074 RepID=A0A348HB50_9GAMM|nr:hypothetical protein ZBT109_0052 [Zymobacter palmae]